MSDPTGEADSTLNWQELYAGMERLPAPNVNVLRRPTQDAIKKWERRVGIIIPPSFREYAQVFGGGELARFFFIYAPCYPGDLDLEVHNREAHTEGREEDYDQPLLIRRLVFFSSTFGGDDIGWDPQAECHIYGLPRYSKRVVRIASSFGRFFMGVLDGSVLAALGFVDRDPIQAVLSPGVMWRNRECATGKALPEQMRNRSWTGLPSISR